MTGPRADLKVVPSARRGRPAVPRDLVAHPSRLLTIDELGAFIQLSASRTRALVKDGFFPGAKIQGKSYRVPLQAAIDYVESLPQA
jgi:hypothetical protein